MNSNAIFPRTGFVRLLQILTVIPVSKSHWWAGVKSGRYPQPIKTLGSRITVWRAEDIHALIAAHSGTAQYNKSRSVSIDGGICAQVDFAGEGR